MPKRSKPSDSNSPGNCLDKRPQRKEPSLLAVKIPRPVLDQIEALLDATGTAENPDLKSLTHAAIQDEDWRVLPPGRVTAEFFAYLRNLIPPEDKLRHRQLDAAFRAVGLRSTIIR